ncbi:MAG: ISKra4 family transposase [Acidobacteriota bacterium]
MSTQPAARADPLAAAREQYADLEKFLVSDEAQEKTHSELEREMQEMGRELMRRLYQAHLDVRGPGEAVGSVRGSDEVAREQVRLHERALETVFGEVSVERAGSGADGVASLHPLDAALNLPPELYSHEVRRRVAKEAAQGSFEKVVASLTEKTGAQVGKRQAEELAVRAAQDFDPFYQVRQRAAHRDPEPGPILVISVDGKGVAMLPEDLREETRRKAESREHKRRKRLSPGEKLNAKRMATVATVYTIAPHVRGAEEVIRPPEPKLVREGSKRPRPEHKRVWASLEKTPEQVITQAVREALWRDPQGRTKHWVVLVDGHENQLKTLRKVWRRYGYFAPTVVLDFIHVTEYIWKAGMALHGAGSPKLDSWVCKHLLSILGGRSGHVAAGIRRSATLRQLDPEKREAVDRCANYLLKNRDYLRYHEYLARGLPIATGVIEGACRSLIKDRLGVSGARWSLAGAEAILRLRALEASGDFDEYWRFHERQEFLRHHAARYAEGEVVPVRGRKRHRLKRIK